MSVLWATGWIWIVRVIAVGALVLVAYVCLSRWPAIVHGHPWYAAVLGVTALAAIAVGVRTLRRRPAATSWWRPILRAVLLLVAGAWLGAVAFLRPFPAQAPATSAMVSDDAVVVRESATEISLSPRGAADPTGLFFQPGARVDARAYAAVLRPVAEAGHPVVIAKQPLGLALLADGAFEQARADRPAVERWVVGGHSLGGVVAALDAEAHDTDAAGKVAGLLLYAAYPAADVSQTVTSPVLSLSGSADGRTTPAIVEQTKALLPADTTYTVIEGAVHAFFGDYGPQPGDGTPSVPRDEARRQITAATLAFVEAAA